MAFRPGAGSWWGATRYRPTLMDTRLSGAILCGGRSRRMGRDKVWLNLGGSNLLDHAIERLRTVADPVILAGGSRPIERPHCLSVLDPVPDRGPLGGVVAALRCSPQRLCAVVAVDMPDLSPTLLVSLAEMWQGEDAVVPLSREGPEPLHAVWCGSALAAVEPALRGGDLSLQGLLARIRVRTVDAALLGGVDPGFRFAVNLNTPADVERWRAAPRQDTNRRTHRPLAPAGERSRPRARRDVRGMALGGDPDAEQTLGWAGDER
jgi:molybdenum cofactor guanylyltransferase